MIICAEVLCGIFEYVVLRGDIVFGVAVGELPAEAAGASARVACVRSNVCIPILGSAW